MSWWMWFLRGTWAILRSGGSLRLVLHDLTAGYHWWHEKRRP